jgi:hypothetical protein
MIMRRKVFGSPTVTTPFVFQEPDGRKGTIRVRVGKPYEVSAREWACPVEIRGFERRYPDMHGANSLQALCLALSVVRSRIDDFVEKGGRLFELDGGSEWDHRGLMAQFGDTGAVRRRRRITRR